MARSSKVDVCLICGEVPCDCSAGNKKKTPARPRASRRDVGGEAHEPTVVPEAAPVQVSRPSMRDKMKLSAAARPVSRPQTVQEPPPQAPSDPDPNLVLAAALRALEPILHPDEKARYSVLLGGSATQAERAAAWRARAQGTP